MKSSNRCLKSGLLAIRLEPLLRIVAAAAALRHQRKSKSHAGGKEKGNLAYDLNRDTENPSHYLVYERWKDWAALEAHLKTPYLKALLAELPKLTDGAPEAQIFVPAGER